MFPARGTRRCRWLHSTHSCAKLFVLTGPSGSGGLPSGILSRDHVSISPLNLRHQAGNVNEVVKSLNIRKQLSRTANMLTFHIRGFSICPSRIHRRKASVTMGPLRTAILRSPHMIAISSKNEETQRMCPKELHAKYCW